ncbi:RdgB/HAM1 family non-canonical purine NTP pyrophosphatase [Thermosynechococcus sp. GLH187]|uniref:RdgB/HAM1 family non-canonical purine NTP pyrophosphatase n=1 Tax=unclassified Thermosynechococcus TaxID=2622553 RepID=UPI0028776F26|nr:MULTISPECIES: RdgB/HAM1 family non-canonical purine NTP pyrophosphatase [unclassified Thermosynechococcus]WNC44862.1 RdgB/HAM1 family non-canonical purine NTP pyrophosphatase [Thermosynechococcus sp. GLH187]WNC47398.1 RdgB/HAM1 family non-canonical purine NTP pyrophosphatase [Thermosynechococcus sp. GLH333]WNC49935.1 RdgB/HAM1 family non-canonical purine NTP pyrophosphatase [Thermosynechococcus sp. GLH87]WNC60089.1 RdgB/HAM1 family non-canonical purine NTP pyrophosphatase [Thermosynechococcu
MPILAQAVLASHNAGKVREFQGWLQPWIGELLPLPATIEIAETADSFVGNACLKATTAAQELGTWAIADDSGLAVHALEGAPGIYSARYGATDAERIERLLREMAGVSDRAAEFICVIALARPDGTIAVTTEGRCAGEILTAPRGRGGFGYDPIFWVPSQQRTFAEMSPTEKQQVSHRGQALQRLREYLQTFHP